MIHRHIDTVSLLRPVEDNTLVVSGGREYWCRVDGFGKWAVTGGGRHEVFDSQVEMLDWLVTQDYEANQ